MADDPLKRIREAIKDGKVKLAGTPPNLNATPDFTVTKAAIDQAFVVRWQTVSAGFGEVTFYVSDDGQLRCDNEGMSRDFVREVLNKLLDDATLG